MEERLVLRKRRLSFPNMVGRTTVWNVVLTSTSEFLGNISTQTNGLITFQASHTNPEFPMNDLLEIASFIRWLTRKAEAKK